MPRSRARLAGWSAAVLLIAGAAIAYGVNYEMAQQDLRNHVRVLTGGEPLRGRQLAGTFGCGGCHEIPGVGGAEGKVGPSLKGVGGRVYLAGRLENRPENMIAWIVNPRAIDPQTAMPPLGVTRAQAQDIAAFLYTLN